MTMMASRQPAPGPSLRTAQRPAAHPLPADGAFVTGVGELLEARTGLVFPGSRRALLERAVTQWLGAMGSPPSPASLRLLEEPNGTALRRLVSLATVGETYFFRHREQLDAFRRVALPSIIEARKDLLQPVMRTWSAGCSSGEEAFSLAMLLEEALPDRARWQVRVVGTDIDEDALERARAGVYGRWAFRATGAERARWFRPVPGGEQIEQRIRDLVVFEHHNLADGAATGPRALGGPADLVVCRNVTIYMNPDATGAIAERLYDALAPGGWLLVGPVEPSAQTYGRFVAHHVDGITLYQRPFAELPHHHAQSAGTTWTSRAAAPAVAASAEAAQRVARPAVAASRDAGSLTAAPRVAMPPSVAPGTARPLAARPLAADPAQRAARTEPRVLLEEARALADAGRLDEALERCQSALARDRRLSTGHLLLATILEARGDLEGACHALGRAAYLEPLDPLTQFRLGLLEWRRGRIDKARGRLRTATALLDGLPDGHLLDGPEELTAGRLRSVVTTLLV